MSDWTEDVFLERLMPLMRQKDGVQRDNCPDVELLCAFSEERIGGADKSAIATHIARCARCRELHSRLIDFATPAAREDELEWTNAEKRLENWMEGVLRSHEREHPYSGTQRGFSNRTRQGNWWSAWKTQWAVGAVSAVALAVLVVLFLRLAPRATHEVQSAQTTVPASPAPISNVLSPTPPPAQSETLGRPGNSAAGGNLVAETGTQPKADEKRLPRPANHELSPVERSPQVVAEANTPKPPEIRGTPPATGQENPPAMSASGSSVVDRTPRIVARLKPVSPPASKTASTQRASFGALSARSSAATISKVVLSLPPSFRLEAGTRLWIRLSSLVRQPDGTVKFEGSLFEPVTQTGVVPLARGTGVGGFEKQSQNTNLLVITEFTVGGKRYALKGEAGVKNTPSSGGGKAVQFDAGQILEMFVDSASVYEISPGATGQQTPR